MLRTHLFAALIAGALLLVGTARGDFVDDFLQAIEDDIDSGNVEEASYTASAMRPNLDIEGIWGYTYWPDGDSAICTWVRARATDSAPIAAWAHTTWSPSAPYRNDVYYFGLNSVQPIQRNHAYYIRGFHWLPWYVNDWPSKEQEGPIAPVGAQGVICSPTYVTEEWNEGEKIRADVCLSGPSAMW